MSCALGYGYLRRLLPAAAESLQIDQLMTCAAFLDADVNCVAPIKAAPIIDL